MKIANLAIDENDLFNVSIADEDLVFVNDNSDTDSDSDSDYNDNIE